jgi:ankyrin repeat protein
VNDEYKMTVHTVNAKPDAPQRVMRRTALHLSSEAGRWENVKSLLYWGADLLKLDDGKRSALLIAASLGRQDAVWELTRGALGHAPSEELITTVKGTLSLAQVEEWPPLHAAAHAGHHRIVHQLLGFAQYLHRTVPKLMTKDDLEAFANAKHEGQKQHQRTALHMASERGHALAINAFAAHDFVKFDLLDKYDETAIQLAKERGHDCELLPSFVSGEVVTRFKIRTQGTKKRLIAMEGRVGGTAAKDADAGAPPAKRRRRRRGGAGGVAAAVAVGGGGGGGAAGTRQ